MHIGLAAQQDFEKNYKTNYTVQYMLRQYWDQWETVKLAKQFLSVLKTTTAYQPLDRPSPIQVIRKYIKNWEKDVQLHKGLNENALRAQLVVALQSAGFIADAETHSFQGHTDIVVSKPLVGGIVDKGHQLVAECKIWKGSAGLYAALSQLCRYVTPNDSHAALIVFVRDGSFNEICKKAVQHLSRHQSFSSPSAGTDCIEYYLRPAQNPESKVSATLLLCNLTTPRYSC